jgi:predicted flavoprotein YhiN
VRIDFLPGRAPDWLLEAKRQRPRAGLRSVLGEALPERLATALAEQIGLGAEMGNLPDKASARRAGKAARLGFPCPMAAKALPRPK